MTSYWWKRYAWLGWLPYYHPKYRQRGKLARAMLHQLSDLSACSQATFIDRHAQSDMRHASSCVQNSVPSLQSHRHLPTRLVLHLIVSVLVLTIIFSEAVWLRLSDSGMPWLVDSPTTSAYVERHDLTDTPAPVFFAQESVLIPIIDGADRMIAPQVQVSRFENTLAFPMSHFPAEGETLADVATLYQVTVDSLIWANGLQTGDVLAVGQELRIPATSGLPYVVQPDDTVEAVAAHFGVAPEAIWLFKPNRMKAGDALTVGQEIFIPNGSAPLPEAFLALYGGPERLGEIAAHPAGVIREARTNMREGPDRVYAPVAQLDAGRRAHLLARHGDWIKLNVAGTSGWVHTDLLDTPPGLVDTLIETSDFPPPPPIWVWPASGSLTSYFGPRWGGFHNGLDIASGAWTPIRAARSGQVIEAGWCRGYGYCVKLAHAGGIETVYGHLIDQPVVGAGESVSAGEVIGHMGSTYDAAGGGYSTGVHLHFEVRVYGRAVDPLKFLP